MVQTCDTDFYITLLLEACHNFTQTSHRISHRISQHLHSDSNGARTARRRTVGGKGSRARGESAAGALAHVCGTPTDERPRVAHEGVWKDRTDMILQQARPLNGRFQTTVAPDAWGARAGRRAAGGAVSFG